MMRLKSKLLSLNADKTIKVKVYTPANCDEVRIPFRKDKFAKVVGKLAQIAPPSDEDHSQLMAGVLVQNGFDLALMAPDDLREYAGLTTTTITCKQHLTLSSASMDLIRWALEGTFGAIEEVGTNPKTETKTEINGDADESSAKQEAADEEIPMEETQTFLVMGCVILRYHSRTREVELEWEGNMMNDGVADAVMAVLLTVESSPASVKRMYLIELALLNYANNCYLSESAKNKHHHHHHDDDIAALPNPHSHLGAEDRLARLLMMLEAQFGTNIAPIDRPRVPADLVNGTSEGTDGVKTEVNEERLADIESAELDRLQALGIPVPGLEITVDKHVARVWLENLEVECTNPVLRDRVRVVVERAVETVAGLWAASSMPKEIVSNGTAKGQMEIDAAAQTVSAIEAQS